MYSPSSFFVVIKSKCHQGSADSATTGDAAMVQNKSQIVLLNFAADGDAHNSFNLLRLESLG
jgi:hypothetical protein